MQISVSEELKKNAKWRLGDVIADNSYSEIYLIVKDNNGDIVAMALDEEEKKKMMIETGITSEEWNIGDVIVSEKKQGIALIVKDNNGLYCAMDIDALDKSVTTYSTEYNAIYYCGGQGYFNKLGMMQSYFASEGWHKAKAVLKVYSNIELGGKEK